MATLTSFIHRFCDNNYPTLAEGNIVLNQYQGNSLIQDIINTLDAIDCDAEYSEESIQELLDSQVISVEDYVTANPENEEKTQYLLVLQITGTPIYFAN